MKNRFRLVLVWVSAIGLAIILSWKWRDHGPTHAGKSVPQWFQQFYSAGSYAGQSWDDEARLEATQALQTLGSDATPFLIKEAFKHRRDTFLSRPFYEVWRKLYPKSPPFINADDLATEAVAALREIKPPAQTILPLLTNALTGPDTFRRRQALIMLGGIGDGAEAGLPFLVQALRQPQPWERGLAAQSLKWLGPMARPVLPGMIEALPLRPCPAYLIQAVGSFGSDARAALPALEAKLTGTNQQDRLRAAVALTQIDDGHPQAIAAIKSAMIANSDPQTRRDPQARRTAIWALREMKSGGADLIPDLQKLTREGGSEFGRVAIDVLERIAPNAAVELLLEQLGSNSPRAQIWAAGRLLRMQPNHPQALALLIDNLKSGSRIGLRSDVVEQLGEVSPDASEAVALLEKIAKDEQDAARGAAEKSLKKIKRKQSGR